MISTSSCVYWPFWKLFNSLAHLLICVYFSELYMFSGYWPLVRWIVCKDFLLFCGLSLYSDKCLFWCAEAFSFEAILFVNSCSCFLSSWKPVQKIVDRQAPEPEFSPSFLQSQYLWQPFVPFGHLGFFTSCLLVIALQKTSISVHLPGFLLN
jgi:hypothetical protein